MLMEYWIACQGTDVIISSLSGFGGPHIAEKLNVPHFWALLQPVSRTRAFPHFMTPATVRLGSRINQLTYRCAERIFWWLFKWPINHLRQQVLGLPALSRPGPYGLLGKTRYPVLYGFSPSVIPKPVDWNEHTHVTGYWFLDHPNDWRLPEDLVAFLQAGSAPIYLGLGRMHIRDPAAHLELMLEVLSRLQKRAVVLSTGLDLHQSDLPNSVFSVDSVPHDWLFPHMSVIVHHGGAGTTASALRAGIPAFSVPGFFDQPFWGQYVPRLGTGPPPVLPHQLSAERLAAAITAADEPAIRAQASRLGAQIRAEDGVRRAVEILNRYLAGA
jgi:UDP:flavonoid glycosyltransferase YjiC (YdhE family)